MQEKRKKICVFRVRQAIGRHPEGRKQEIGPETGALQDTCTARVECKCGSWAVQVSLVSRASVAREPYKCPTNRELLILNNRTKAVKSKLS